MSSCVVVPLSVCFVGVSKDSLLLSSVYLVFLGLFFACAPAMCRCVTVSVCACACACACVCVCVCVFSVFSSV